MLKDLDNNYQSRNRLSLIKKLIKSHLDFYFYDNNCDYTQGNKTKEEWHECYHTIKKIDSLIDFAFNKIQQEEEDKSTILDKLDTTINGQTQYLNELDTQLGDIKVSKKKVVRNE